MGVFLILIIILFIIYSHKHSSQSNSSGGPNVSFNEITYPADIKCDKCKEIIPITPYTIDDTWDLKCPNCKEIGFKHPKSDERRQQLNDMMDW